ncbi:hypothetical protein FJT64_006361 [Amphibalanus amphitrite]|uniref:Uncharacterized protein n=1 Tax=Amphibalanus amphitrite TaxID=1232801 RepID=A0A6A4VTC8_AMPAM|nr:hypothetical protein FJT64_006361 [Amphibalanus amphitrite]
MVIHTIPSELFQEPAMLYAVKRFGRSLRRQQQSTPPPTSLFTELGTTATARPCDLISDHALPDHNSFQALSADCEPSADPLWADCEPSADPLWADCEPSADPLAVAEHRRLQQERKQRTREGAGETQTLGPTHGVSDVLQRRDELGEHANREQELRLNDPHRHLQYFRLS